MCAMCIFIVNIAHDFCANCNDARLLSQFSVYTGEVSWDMYLSSIICEDDMINFPFPTTCSVEVPSFDDDDANNDDVDRYIMNPPPSVSTTAFPSSVAQMMANGSSLSYCAIANAPSAKPSFAPTRFPTSASQSSVSFSASQVSPKLSHFLLADSGQHSV